MGIVKLSVEFNGKEGQLILDKQGEEKRIDFGLEDYKIGCFPETHYYGDTIGIPKGEMYKCMAIGQWTQEDKLVIRVYIIDDYFGNMNITLGYKGEELGVFMSKTAEWFLNEYQGFAGGRLSK